jgi:hypothetical protein
MDCVGRLLDLIAFGGRETRPNYADAILAHNFTVAVGDAERWYVLRNSGEDPDESELADSDMLMNCSVSGYDRAVADVDMAPQEGAAHDVTPFPRRQL